MIGVVAVMYQQKVKRQYLLAILFIILGILSFRTILRGSEYNKPMQLLYSDISASKDNYMAYSQLADRLNAQGNYASAKTYAERSVKLFPGQVNCLNLAIALTHLGQYPEAQLAYNDALKYGGNNDIVFGAIGDFMLLYGAYDSNTEFLRSAPALYPNSPKLWIDLAII